MGVERAAGLAAPTPRRPRALQTTPISCALAPIATPHDNSDAMDGARPQDYPPRLLREGWAPYPPRENEEGEVRGSGLPLHGGVTLEFAAHLSHDRAQLRLRLLDVFVGNRLRSRVILLELAVVGKFHPHRGRDRFTEGDRLPVGDRREKADRSLRRDADGRADDPLVAFVRQTHREHRRALRENRGSSSDGR